jgi:hypothetical protein
MRRLQVPVKELTTFYIVGGAMQVIYANVELSWIIKHLKHIYAVFFKNVVTERLNIFFYSFLRLSIQGHVLNPSGLKLKASSSISGLPV